MKNDKINILINKCIELVDKARTNHKDSQEIKKILYLSCITLCLFYKDKVSNRIYNLLKTSTIYCQDDYLENIISKYASSQDITEADIKDITEYSSGVSIYDQYQSHIFISTTLLSSKIELIEGIIHELNHVFVGKNTRYINNKLYLLCGFSYEIIKEDNSKEYHGIEFNEIINSLVSEEMINILIWLSHFNIENNTINDYLKEFRNIAKYYTHSYIDLVSNFRDFYKDKYIHSKIKLSLALNDYKILATYINNSTNDETRYDTIIKSLRL